MSFLNKVIVITGAASGLGSAIALAFAKRNASLCIVDIHEEGLLKTKEECEKLSEGKVSEIVADLSKDEDIKRIVKTVILQLGKIDVLVNCAGIYRVLGLHHPDFVKTLDEVISVNLRGTIVLTKEALPALVVRKGCVVNVSSITSTQVAADSIAYAASKAGITNFTKNAAFELAKLGVRVNCVSPGPVMTNILRNAGISENNSSTFWNHLIDTLPMNKLAKAEDVAEMVVHLSSDKASSITGSDFVVDAGMSLGTSYDNSSISGNKI